MDLKAGSYLRYALVPLPSGHISEVSGRYVSVHWSHSQVQCTLKWLWFYRDGCYEELGRGFVSQLLSVAALHPNDCYTDFEAGPEHGIALSEECLCHM